MDIKKILCLVGGIICMMIGAINLLLPVVPTSPFLILGLFLIAKFSPRLHYFFMNFTIFGHSIKSTLNTMKEKFGRDKDANE